MPCARHWPAVCPLAWAELANTRTSRAGPGPAAAVAGGPALPEVGGRPRLLPGPPAARALRLPGELRATGDVLVDMLPLLQRTGFDAVRSCAPTSARTRRDARWASSPATTRATCTTAPAAVRPPAASASRLVAEGGTAHSSTKEPRYERHRPACPRHAGLRRARGQRHWPCCATPPPRIRAASCRPPAWGRKTWSSPT
jgi:hypothetical protein